MEKSEAAREMAALREEVAMLKLRLRESAHRFKNDLQVLSGIVQFTAHIEKDRRLKETLLELDGRIEAMTAVHTTLASHDGMNASIAALFSQIAGDVRKAFGCYEVELSVEGDAFIEGQRAIALGCVFWELCANSFKHAFLNGKGHIGLSIGNSGDHIRIRYCDSGPGRDDTNGVSGLGSALAEAFLDKAAAHIERGDSDMKGFSLTVILEQNHSGDVSKTNPTHALQNKL